MRLVNLELELENGALPADIAALLDDVDACIRAIEQDPSVPLPAFVPSDYPLVYRSLEAIRRLRLAPGNEFLEWGSGLGVVACMADFVGFVASGIEFEPDLVRHARHLARAHRFNVPFACGSFVPPGAEPHLDQLGGVTWLASGGPDGYEELGAEIDDFDIIFAYPWPGEEQVLFDLFTEYAALGALLLTYHGQEGMRLQRKVRARSG